MSNKRKEHLKYGEGQREQYGEGLSYRPEDKTEGADKMGESDGFAGGEVNDKGPSSRKMPDGKK